MLKKMQDVIIWLVDAVINIVGFVYNHIINIIIDIGHYMDAQVNIFTNIYSMV